MKKDKLKNYIKAHRPEFDEYQADKDALWTRINDALPSPEPKIIPIWKRTSWRVAASVVVLIGCGWFFFNTSESNSEGALVHQELVEVDTYYQAIVNSQVRLIKDNPNLSKNDQADFLLLIDDLDEEYSKLKTELKEGINDQKIMQAIIHNYRKKIELMEKLLEKSYPLKNEHDETEYTL